MGAGNGKHVILMVWDGMRFDYATPENAPNLCKLAEGGVTFLHHHPVYISVTEVNATAMATGVYPGQSGIIGNNDFRPGIDPNKPIESDSESAIRKGDSDLPEHFIAYPTVAEILHANGLRTAITGTKPVALLHDRAERADGDPNGVVFAGNTLPASLKEKLEETLGEFPKAGLDKIKLDQWTLGALTNALWKDNLPDYSLLWMAEPDFSQHRAGPGSAAALKAIKGDDDNLGKLIEALRAKNMYDSTDIIIVSDHGFSTVLTNCDVAKTLEMNGIPAYRRAPRDGQKPGDVMVVGNAGSVFCYVNGHDAKRIEQVVHCLQAQEYAGVIFSSVPVEGAFSLADGHVDTTHHPDVIMAMRWTPDISKTGAPVMIYSDGTSYTPGHGTHGTLSMTDMHNICFASGPDFAKGMKDSLPSGNIDVAPTILWLLGVQPKEKMTGRVLSEALTIPAPPIGEVIEQRKESSFKGDGFTWRQYLDWSSVNGVQYFDQGDGMVEKSSH